MARKPKRLIPGQRRERPVYVPVRPELRDILNSLAALEHRHIGPFCLVLIEEALKARGQAIPPTLPPAPRGPKPGSHHKEKRKPGRRRRNKTSRPEVTPPIQTPLAETPNEV